MKKLTILLLLFTVFAFAEWDVDPDYDDLTVRGLEVDSTIINDYFLVGDTTTASGGFVIKDNVIEVWRDTLSFHCWDRMFQEYIGSGNWAQIYCEDLDEGGYLMIKSYRTGAGMVKILSDECHKDTNEIRFYRATVYPGLDTLDAWGGVGAPVKGYSQVGSSQNRFGQSHILYQYQLDASKADTSVRWMGADTLYHESENPNKFDNDVVVDGEFTSNGITQFPYVDLDIDDTEEYELTVADGKAGWGMASLDVEWTFFRFTAVGVVTLVNNTTNVTTTDGTDNNFNIFDAGTTIKFENQLGNDKELNINVWFTP